MIQKLSHVTIYVLDHDQALDFYTNKLGFEVRMDMTVDGGFRWLTVGPKSQPDLQLVLFAVKPGGMFDDATADHLRAHRGPVRHATRVRRRRLALRSRIAPCIRRHRYPGARAR